MIRTFFKLQFSLLLVLIFSTSVFSQSAPKMITVDGGSFMMGNDDIKDVKEDGDEAPAHKVSIKSYEIGEHEVTVAQYRAYTESAGKKMPPDPDAEWLSSHEDTKKFYPTISNPFWGWKNNFPMNNVSWFDAIEYCNWLSSENGLDKVYSKNVDDGWDTDISKNGYRLPTEAEWEFAAKGGNKSKGTEFSGSANSADVAWYDETTKVSGPKDVKRKQANELGIYDMSGNVWEWCSDYYSKKFYANSAAENPFNAKLTSWRVLRGGGWHYKVQYATVTSRDGPTPAYSNYNTGFRLARTK